MTDAEALALAVEAAGHWGGCDAPRLIKNRENAVFEVELPDARAALRLHRVGYQSEAAIRSELWWISELARTGLPVSVPLMTRSRDLLVDLGGGRLASAILWVEGQPIGAGGVALAQSAAEQVALHHQLGRLLARVHAATDALALPSAFERPRWSTEGLLGEAPLWGRFWEHPALNPADAALLRRARLFAQERLAGYAGLQGLIHADVLRENVFVHQGQPTLIDFDDGGFGWRMYDLGTALRDCLEEPLLPAISAALMEGYSEVLPLGADDRALLSLFVMLRCLASVGWTIPRLAADDPGAAAHIARAIRVARIVLAGEDLWQAR